MTIEIHKPELETLIRERMESGGYENVEDVLLHAMQSSHPGVPPKGGEVATTPPRKKQSLSEFLLNSPLRGSGLVAERQKDYAEPIDL